MGKAAQLDRHNVPAAANGTTPMVSLDQLQDNFNALLAATLVAGSIPLLTAKLDADAGVTDTNYAATLNPVAANALTKFNALLAKLDADTLVGDTDYVALLTATSATLYTKYVALLAKLDADSGVSATNHGATALLATDYASLFVIALDSQ